MAVLMNEQIKASEVLLTGIDGEELGVMPRDEALALARRHKADLVCLSLMSSPPPCKLIGKGTAKEAALREKRNTDPGRTLKVKEIRLTVGIEDHDYDTKRRQADKLLTSGHPVQLAVRLQGPKQGAEAKALLERLSADLSASGKRATGIQVSGKGAAVQLNPLR
ncbi:translation initiation factor IF-3 [Paenibacillus beijingensis]|uniref:Translation initiation factor IF-3 n=1 Tax=Paenibacillus beijingensis TaxID=1126833 RepID=A0A0D5NJW1_9BACL|nr:translation initiation factor IF-3 [Paenibacillus beijingensis]AJY75208.1 translation initiation factor IF-3 [Paenibacillus beijingensis]